MEISSIPVYKASPNVVPNGDDVRSITSVQDLSAPEPSSTSGKKTLKLESLTVYKQKSNKLKKDELPFQLFKPSTSEVDLAALLDLIVATTHRFVVIDNDQLIACALWTAHTYLVDVFDTSPLLIIDAPEKACAKTLLQQIIASMSFRALSASNATPSVLFRSVELWNPTLFFDEADTFFKDKNELAGMINGGYKKSGFVLRSEAVGDSFEPKKFSVYGAKSIAGIALDKHIPDATLSRGIIIKMRRKLPDESIERLRYAEDGLFENISSKLMRFAEDYAQQVFEARPHLPDELSDRAQDNWEPLLAIASCASEEWLQRATDVALRLSSAKNESVSTGNELLSDIQYIFSMQAGTKNHADKISSADLIIALTNITDGPWATHNFGKPITARQLSKQLANYGIHSKTVRIGKYETPKGYALDQFTDAFSRYVNQSKDDDDAGNDDLQTPKPHINPILNIDDESLY
jgi:hypothetical protein